MPLFFMATAQAKATPMEAVPLPLALTYTTINMMGTSTTPADTVEVVEWDAATALRNPDGPMPWTSWPYDMPPPGVDNITDAVVEEPPAADPTPGSEIKWNTKAKLMAVTQDGTSGATAKTNLATTTQGNGTGLTVNLAAAGGKVTEMTVGNNAGSGYQMGDVVAVTATAAGTSQTVIGVVSWVSQ